MKPVDNSPKHGPPTNGADFLTVLDWAQRLQVSKRQIFRMIDARTIPPFDFSVGKTRRWHISTYEKWVDQQCERN